MDDLMSDVDNIMARLTNLERDLEKVSIVTSEMRALVGPFGVPLPGDLMLVQTLHGTKYIIDPNDRIMAPQLIIYRQWEADLSALFLLNVDKDSVVVDVGANFGYFTCLAGSRIGNSGSGFVTAVEPNPKLLALLRDNCRINWSMAPIHIHGCAAGNEPGIATLSIPRNGAANASLSKLAGDNDQVDVEIITIDSIIPSDISVDIMKIDVEGHELAVLKGAKSTIDRSPSINIVMEWSVPQMHAAGVSTREMISGLQDLALIPKRIPQSGMLPDAVPMSWDNLASLEYDNIILSRK